MIRNESAYFITVEIPETAQTGNFREEIEAEILGLDGHRNGEIPFVGKVDETISENGTIEIRFDCDIYGGSVEFIDEDVLYKNFKAFTEQKRPGIKVKLYCDNFEAGTDYTMYCDGDGHCNLSRSVVAFSGIPTTSEKEKYEFICELTPVELAQVQSILCQIAPDFKMAVYN